MKLKNAIDIAKDCGLETIGEAIFNIRMHAMNIFTYGQERDELIELIEDFKNSGLNKDSKIEECEVEPC